MVIDTQSTAGQSSVHCRLETVEHPKACIVCFFGGKGGGYERLVEETVELRMLRLPNTKGLRLPNIKGLRLPNIRD